MELKIKAIHFDATEKLQEFIAKKVAKIEKISGEVRKVEVVLKVEKPETAQNKVTSVLLAVPNEELFVEKKCDTFEEGVDLCVEALQKQLTKYKEKHSGR
ncbi:MAG: ribosome-associated translation inhibitor RaiA [Bacteroidaceae bacterium]